MPAFRTTAVLALALACAGLGVGAGPAMAADSITGFSLTPSSTQANGSPNIASDITFGGYASSTDSVKDLSLTLAAGLYANPTAVTATCTPAQLSSDSCPAASQVGTGSVTANLSGFATVSGQVIPANFFLMDPAAPNEASRIGLAGTFLNNHVSAQAPVTVRTSPDVGLNIAFSNLPNTAAGGGVNVQITEVKLTLNGAAPGGKAFTRLPTSCPAATTGLTADFYTPGTSSSSSAFTPTGCDTLPYTPLLSAAAALDSTGGAALTLTSTQLASEAATHGEALGVPPSLAPRPTTVGAACAAGSDPAACPSVGSAKVTTPLLAQPLAGKVVLMKSAAPLGFPGMTVVFPQPFPLRLDGTTSIAPGGLTETFGSIPDVPITKLEVQFSGGANSLFVGTPAACVAPGTVSGSFTAWSGKSASPSAPLVVSGCPAPTLPAQSPVVGPNGVAGVLVPCTGAPCSGTALLTAPAGSTAKAKKKKGKALVLGRAAFTRVPAGKTTRVSINLSKAALKLLAKHRGRLAVTLTVNYTSPRKVSASRTITLVAKKRGKR
jgi:hypothetical protein